MSTVKDLAQLGKRIAAQHGWAAAKAFKAYEMNEADRAVLSKCATDLLKVFPPVSGVAAEMSAALAVGLESRLAAPIHVVAGTLAVEGVPVFGDRTPFDGAEVFSTPNPDWNGHVWVMIGPYVVDIAIFRAAYSRQGPARLARHIDLNFGPNKGLYVDLWRRTQQVGLSYEPHYVLSADEVTRLMGGAYHIIKQAQPEQP
ncbi:hypothetical protein EDF56_102324 [Novosphingobium sp. PhB165]|uniref:hypothetical protein n=1 Tax=Novosphingobium sp. PhB165 TaxID=2485105 RepID=UPI00104BAADF|nr:hypothetical protein [Novosphingobium sp. PhB165]TCM20661.1 hypothetical protein EDF56_102324 [Novosphingobium sp. PhB165]